ncbi:MAG: hypothetical protein GY816_24020 [Cytophagales bacterium]|nr:hypothetical protein [Cytophagales bacterium]
MKKFKFIFYPIYLIFALGLIYFSLDSFVNMEQMLTWFNETFTLENQPYWVMALFLFLAILMVTEMIAENIQISRIKEEIPDLEDEIVRLKAKLYDQFEGEEDDEDGDDEDDEDD